MNKLQEYWKQIQAFLDISGDAWMSLFTGIILARIIAVLSGHLPLTNSEACTYASAVGAFAYSNTGKPKL